MAPVGMIAAIGFRCFFGEIVNFIEGWRDLSTVGWVNPVEKLLERGFFLWKEWKSVLTLLKTWRFPQCREHGYIQYIRGVEKVFTILVHLVSLLTFLFLFFILIFYSCS